MRSFIFALTLVVASTGGAAAALVSVTGTPTEFGSDYITRDLDTGLFILPDPWPDSGAVVTATITIAPGAMVDVVYRGGRGGDFVEFLGDRRLFDTSEARPGDTLAGFSAEVFLTMYFGNEGEGARLQNESDVAVQAFGNMLEIAWDRSGASYSAVRLAAVITPVPTALPLLATGLVALGVWRRSRASSASWTS